MALDYASILQAGQQLVPDLARQAMLQQQQQLQQQEIDARTQAIQANAVKAQQAQQRQASYQRDLDQTLLSGGDPRAIQRLMLKYPEMSENLKPVLDSIDKDTLQRNQTQLGTVYVRAQSGDYKGAAAALQERVDADKAAGQPDEADQAVLDAFNSGDPTQQKAAAATVGIHLAALVPDKFAETYGKLNAGEAGGPVQKEYDWRVANFGKAAADQWLSTQDTKLVPVQQGGTVYAYGPNAGTTPAQPEGGDQPTPASGYSMPVRNGTFAPSGGQYGASRPGGRVHNGIDIDAPEGSPIFPVKPGKVVAVGDQGDKLGGLFVRVKHPDGTVTSYAHMGHQAVTVGEAVGPDTPLGTVGTTGNATGPVLHFVARDKNGRTIDPRPLFGAPVKVRTKQDYDKLATGTPYEAPDGSHRVKG